MPVAQITAVFSLAEQMGVSRIVKGVNIPHPCGDPKLPAEKDRQLRKRIVEAAFKALQTDVNEQATFTPCEEGTPP